MKTQELILQKSLELFNIYGIKAVTLRQIAKALSISQGNLNYHFKTKAEIVSRLYFMLVEKMDMEMSKLNQNRPILSVLFDSALVSMTILYQYRFITRDLYVVLQGDETLKKHYLQLQKIRKQQYLFLFQNMKYTGLMREEEFDFEYERLYERMNIFGDNWINAADFFKKDQVSVVPYYHMLLFEIIYPYLTNEGKQQYLEMVG